MLRCEALVDLLQIIAGERKQEREQIEEKKRKQKLLRNNKKE